MAHTAHRDWAFHVPCGSDPENATLGVFDDECAEYSAENKLTYKVAVANAVYALDMKVPVRIMRFLSVLCE